MRIGLVIGQLTAGGAERQLSLVARALRSWGWEPIVYSTSEKTDPFGDEIRAAGVPLRAFGGSPPERVARLRAALVGDGVRVVHSWLYLGNAYAFLAVAGRKEIPLVTSARNCKRQGGAVDVLNRLAFRRSRAIVANSRLVADYVSRAYGAPRERVVVVYNGVDLGEFGARAGDGREGLVVGMGRLVRQKNPDLFVDAAARLSGRAPDASFVFFGEGPLRRSLEKKVGELGLGRRVSLPGITKDVPGVLARASLFWLTSEWEGLPNVVLEAMASGVPPIATDVGGTRELFRSGREGFLVAPGDVSGFVDYSSALLSDAACWRAFSSRARERAARFSKERMLESMRALYESLGR
ncbi:MAG: hypothetical protein KatS3mg076_0443 [Candidatus Binatia bacterium]|nr:MAG: hypothetical protein KatS3mg076_0443 [Candidatus Binatia bacterium]